MLEHGGQLRAASLHYGIPLSAWLDLSTGINPVPFEPPALPLEAWARLPQEQDGLESAAASYYGTPNLLPVAGSQAAIQALPRLRPRCRVGVLHPGYAEHAQAWRNAGHEVAMVAPDNIDEQLARLDVLVLMQPNNPTGAVFAGSRLEGWYAQLSARGGWLLVDEAFVDASPATSLIKAEMPPGLIVLRSLGKYFGLAGARVGFVASHPDLLSGLRELLGPWCIAGPARHAAQAALLDHAWQAATSRRLQSDAARLAQLLRSAGLAPAGGCDLFQWVKTDQADRIHRQLAQAGILTRYFAEPQSLRFGLPGGEAAWVRLEAALETLGVCA